MGTIVRVGRSVATLSICLLIEACLFSASQKEWTPEPWPEGAFELHAGSGVTAVTGHLEIDADGEMAFSSSSGTCSERTALEVAQDRNRNQRTFRCSGPAFRIHPRGGTIQGEVSIPVRVTVRGQRFCATYGENGECVHYEYRERVENRVQTYSLQVTRKE